MLAPMREPTNRFPAIRPTAGVGAAALAGVHLGLLLWCGAKAAPTVDEPAHLVAGLSYWEFGRFDLYRVNPPLTKLLAAAPTVLLGREDDWSLWSDDPGKRPAFQIAVNWQTANGARGFELLRAGRAVTAAFSLLGLWVCFRWGRDRHGPAGGLLAAGLWAFNPSILAHGCLLTPDVPSAATGLAAAYAFGRFLTGPTAGAALWAGLLLGAANLTKTTWVLLFPLWPAAAAWAWWGRRSGGREFAKGAGLVSLVLIVGAWVLCGGYGFEGVGKPLGTVPFVSQQFAGPEAGYPGASRDADGSGNRWRGTPAGRAPLPVPENWLRGVDVQRRDFERSWESYLFGEWRTGGWWYYELAAAAVKEPVGLLVLGGLALWAAGGPRRAPGGDRVVAARSPALWQPPLAVLVAVSLQTSMSQHPRYLIPAYGFVFVGIAGAVRLWTAPGGGRLARRTVLAISAVAAAAEPSAALPWPHAFINAAAGGPANSWRLLHNSGVDWGQADAAIGDWRRAAPDRVLDGAAIYGRTPRALLGLPDAETPHVPAPGVWAISAGRLAEPKYAAWRTLEPVATVGGNANIYRVEDGAAVTPP